MYTHRDVATHLAPSKISAPEVGSGFLLFLFFSSILLLHCSCRFAVKQSNNQHGMHVYLFMIFDLPLQDQDFMTNRSS